MSEAILTLYNFNNFFLFPGANYFPSHPKISTNQSRFFAVSHHDPVRVKFIIAESSPASRRLVNNSTHDRSHSPIIEIIISFSRAFCLLALLLSRMWDNIVNAFFSAHSLCSPPSTSPLAIPLLNRASSSSNTHSRIVEISRSNFIFFHCYFFSLLASEPRFIVVALLLCRLHLFCFALARSLLFTLPAASFLIFRKWFLHAKTQRRELFKHLASLSCLRLGFSAGGASQLYNLALHSFLCFVAWCRMANGTDRALERFVERRSTEACVMWFRNECF